MKEFIVNAENEGQRFDKYLGRLLSDGGMAFIYKMLRKKNFVLNDKKADGKEILKNGDNIKLFISDDTYDKFKSKTENIIDKINNNKNIKVLNLDIKSLVVYEDKDILLINKPVGVLSQKAQKGDTSINEMVLEYFINSGNVTRESLVEYKPSVINRLDRNTTGIIIVAKSLKAARLLSDDLKNRKINKYYRCVVKGKFDKNGCYSAYLTKNKKENLVIVSDHYIDDMSEHIETEYSVDKIVTKNNTNVSYLNVHLITGKSHQIRAHLSHLGFPIIGDPKYGDKNTNSTFKAKSQMLHAYKIEFPKYEDKYGFEFSGKTYICEPDFMI